MFHISDIKKFNNCHKLYYLEKDMHGSFFNYLKNDYSLTDLMIKLFNLENPFIGSVGDEPSLVIQNIDSYNSFINARFAYDEMRIKPFLLIKNDEAFDLYFFHQFTPKELDINSYFINYDVLIHNNIKINDIYMITVNNHYIFNQNLDVFNTFNVSNTFNNRKIIDIVKECSFDYKEVINSIKASKDDINKDFPVKRNCLMCSHLEDCFRKGFEDNSILHLVSSQNKFDMLQNGRKYLKDFDISLLEGTSLQYAQIMADRNNGIFIDKPLVKEFMKQMDKRPITFIDFEWDTYLLPIYNGMKCFGSLPFEYCLYILDENGNLTNKSYVGLGDCREEFILNLINDLPSDGPIVAFNSFSAEVLRLNELKEQFPKYSNELIAISKRFVDLAEPFSKGMLYETRFAGKLSVKNLVSVINGTDYKKLDVKDGLDAVYNYRKYVLNKDENIKRNLIEYCNLDAYSLIIIYNYLNDLANR